MASALSTQGASFYLKGDYVKAIEYYKSSLKIREEISDQQGIASSLNNLGNIFKVQGDYAKAIDYHTKSLIIKEEFGDKKGIASSLNNLGNIYNAQGDYAKAIEGYSKSLKIYENLGEKYGIATSLNNMGNVYKAQGDYVKAIEYYSKSLKIKEESSDKQGVAVSLNNLGNIYFAQGYSALNKGNKPLSTDKYAKAIECYSKSLRIREEFSDKQGIATCLNNLGSVYKAQGYYAKAFDYQQRSLKIKEQIGDKQGIASSLTNIGIIYKAQGDYVKALDYCSRSLVIAQEIGAAQRIKDATTSLWKIHKNLGNYKESLEMYELYIETRDSIESEENQKEVIRQEYKYEYEKQALKDSIAAAKEAKVKDAELAAEKAERKKKELEIEQQEQQAYLLYGGLGLAILFGGFIFNRFRVTRKQKGIIETQKERVDEAYEQLEEKNKEITDSIQYAKRIQSAILPPQKLVKSYLKESFILYKPKDIVAGDFYWMESISRPINTVTIQNQSSPPYQGGEPVEWIYFAAADCTGHGVPGAMVSVVCSNALSKALIEENITEPGKILDRTRELVIERFGRSEEEIKDGMDISLCALNLKTKELQWAGANNPLWTLRKTFPPVISTLDPDIYRPGGADKGGVVEKSGLSEGYQLIEMKADKQPIGKYGEEKPFTNHTVQLKDGDSLYIFSDGYPDQFGGEKGKKYKSGKMKKFLLSIQDKPMKEQRDILNKEFETCGEIWSKLMTSA